MIKSEITRLLRAARYSIQGLLFLLRNERNFIYLLLLIVITLFLYLGGILDPLRFFILLIFMVVITGLEIFNTALERTLDLDYQEYHPQVKIIKDITSAAVFLSLIIFFILLLIFLFS